MATSSRSGCASGLGLLQTHHGKQEDELKLRGAVDLDSNDDKAIRILTRCLEWKPDGIYVEADPKHSELIVSDMGLKGASGINAPSVKVDPDPGSPLLISFDATNYSRVVARCNFLAADRADIQQAATKVCELNNFKCVATFGATEA